MRHRFRPKRNFNRRYSSAPAKTNQDLMWAITAGLAENAPPLVNNQTAYIPKHKFEDFPISLAIKKNIANKKYEIPTPIQDKSIPAICAGKDIIGIANTGTGKTAAFLVQLIDKVFKEKRQRVLIIAPTRELALQIYEQFGEFAKELGIHAVLCIGGASLGRQRKELAYNPQFVIGTPGRIRDLIGQRCLNLSEFGNVVLDEGDRMVDIGFIGDIKYFISLLPINRQSLFFSATISSKVQEIIRTFVKNPVTISVKDADTCENISQKIVKVASHEQKVDKLHDLLNQEGFEKILIFGRTKRGIQKLTNQLADREIGRASCRER